MVWSGRVAWEPVHALWMGRVPTKSAVQIRPAPPCCYSGAGSFITSRAPEYFDLEAERSPYKDLLKDREFKRWIDNVTRGSKSYGYEMLRRMGFIQKRFKKSPSQIAKMTQKQAANFILDMIGELEKEKRSGSYMSNLSKAVKGWLDWNGIQVKQKIRIPGREELVRVADERTPTPDELKRILDAADLKAKTACAIVAFSGTRIEVMGDYLGDDGLKIRDFPEMKLGTSDVTFDIVPTIINVRRGLSKSGNQYFTFLCEEGCEYLRRLLVWRIMRGEKLTKESPIISPYQLSISDKHIRTNNVGDIIRKPIRLAGFDWRPYVLRRYFDTRMMMAETDGLIIRDYRQFWMGHVGDIEAVYTLRKGLSKDVVEKMRESYAKATDKYLVTGRRETLTKEQVLETMNAQFLRLAGYTDEEISKMSLDNVSPAQLQDLVRRKSMEILGVGVNNQKIVPLFEIRNYILQGWEYVRELPNNEAIIKLPNSN